MNKLNITAIAAAISLAFSAGALAAQGLSKEEYEAGKDKIAAVYKSAKADCDALSANAKDVCMAEAKGKQKVAKAELEARNKPGDKTRSAVSIAKAEADYAVAKEKCDDLAVNDKKVCVKEAKAAEARAKADARAQMKASDASKPAKEKSTAAASKKSTPGEYVDDAVITTKVKAAVLEEPSLKSAEINVETSKGRVQLSGFVRSRADINKAVEVAKGVNGVKSVKNDMIVKGQQ
ncbi:MAG: BON domain-containing protein [Burkholderiales bacterium]|nr:BON domain-containing protein [Burkholderiales bacterium]